MFCQYCNRSAKSLRSNQQHEIRCKENTGRISLEYLKGRTKNQPMWIPNTACLFCQKNYNNKIALSNHVIRCKCNPDRKLQVMTPEGKIKHIESNKKRILTAEQRSNHSNSMKRAVENNPDAYTSANRGRTKQIIVDGIKFQGQWEVDFYLWAKQAGLNPRRSDRGFKYEWNGERTYYPDFYIESKDLYVEVKGYETERDRSKWLQFPEKLCIIKEKEITQIKNNIFQAGSLVSQSSGLINH